MLTIFKYALYQGPNTLSLPKSAQVLDVQPQGMTCAMWVHLDTDEETVNRKFYLYATGEALPKNCGRYIGTVQCVLNNFSPLVWHAYELEEA